MAYRRAIRTTTALMDRSTCPTAVVAEIFPAMPWCIAVPAVPDRKNTQNRPDGPMSMSAARASTLPRTFQFILHLLF
jgi:hypothetical protein